MRALIQRVTAAEVRSGGELLGAIGPGILVLLGVARDDDEARARGLLQRVLRYRIFADAEGRMNLSLLDTQGSLLVVSQFTLVAETAKGLRPGFSRAADPEQGRRLYEAFLDAARAELGQVASGRFGAQMDVSLTNDGPVTFLLES